MSGEDSLVLVTAGEVQTIDDLIRGTHYNVDERIPRNSAHKYSTFAPYKIYHY